MVGRGKYYGDNFVWKPFLSLTEISAQAICIYTLSIMTVLEIIALALIIITFIVLSIPIIVSRSIFFKRKLPETPENRWEDNDDIKAKWYLDVCIDATKKDSRIISGALYPKVYDDEITDKVGTWLEGDTQRKMRILVGPQIQCIKEEGANSLWELYKSEKFSGRLEIRILPVYPKEHFRVIDMTGLYREDGHEQNATKRRFNINLSSFTNAPVFALDFDEAWNKTNPDREPTFELID